jgi:hypothetical protein
VEGRAGGRQLGTSEARPRETIGRQTTSRNSERGEGDGKEGKAKKNCVLRTGCRVRVKVPQATKDSDVPTGAGGRRQGG